MRQLYMPVQWTGCVEALVSAGARRIAECGPGNICEGGLCTPGDRTCSADGDCAAGVSKPVARCTGVFAW